MIERAKQITDEPERKSNMVASIANFMKMSYVTWNKDSVSDESIINDLKTLSNGELVLDENVNLNKVEVRATPNKARQNNNFKQRNNNNNNNRNSNNKNNNRNTGKSRY
jgi:3-phosphoglycerate kinase